jgi:hypothetical protein
MKTPAHFILGILLFGLGSAAFACSCADVPSIKQAFRETDIIFRGRVVAEKVLKVPDHDNKSRQPHYFNFTEYTFEIQAIYKGRIRQKSVTVTTSRGCCACGFPFEMQREYIVYADWDNHYHSNPWEVPRFLSTSICERTTPDVSEEIKAIKQVKWWRKAVPLYAVDVEL